MKRMWTRRVVNLLRRISHRRGKSEGIQIWPSFPRRTETYELFPELKEGEKTIGRQILERFWAEDR